VVVAAVVGAAEVVALIDVDALVADAFCVLAFVEDAFCVLAFVIVVLMFVMLIAVVLLLAVVVEVAPAVVVVGVVPDVEFCAVVSRLVPPDPFVTGTCEVSIVVADDVHVCECAAVVEDGTLVVVASKQNCTPVGNVPSLNKTRDVETPAAI